MVSGDADGHAADPHYQQPYDGESSSGSYNGNGNDNNDDDDDDDDEMPERESPRSENSRSFTPVASATATFPWKPQPPSITLRIPQGPDTYPTPPGDHTSSFSPSQQSIGSPYQQTMNTGDFTPSTNYGLDVGFGQSTPTATRSPVAPFNPDDLYSPTHQRLPDLSIPQILITQDDPVVRSPMMPAGYQHHYPIEQQMGPPPPRQLQQQQQSSNAYPSGSSQAFGGGRGMQQGEVISYGFKTFPPAKFRMRFDRGFE